MGRPGIRRNPDTGSIPGLFVAPDGPDDSGKFRGKNRDSAGSWRDAASGSGMASTPLGSTWNHAAHSPPRGKVRRNDGIVRMRLLRPNMAVV